MFLKNYFGREETKSVTKELVGSILEEEITEIDLEQNLILEKNIKVVILIVDFELKNLKDVDHWITEWELRGKDYTNKILTPVEKIVILELPKFKKYKNKTQNQELRNWVEFIINPEKKMQGESIEIEKARRVLEMMSQDKNERYLAELRQKYIMDQKAIEDAGYDKGYDSGTLEGKRKEKLEIAKKLKSMDIDTQTIVESTGLTKEEIEKLYFNILMKIKCLNKQKQY